MKLQSICVFLDYKEKIELQSDNVIEKLVKGQERKAIYETVI